MVKRSTKKKLCNYQLTNKSLHEWYTDVFEKFGWMMLAKSKGDQIISYNHTINKLIHQIECKINAVSDSDIKDDLAIMRDNCQWILSQTLCKN